jgi:hypothetical protein
MVSGVGSSGDIPSVEKDARDSDLHRVGVEADVMPILEAGDPQPWPDFVCASPLIGR